MSREEYDSIVKPSDMIVINAFNAVSPYNILHMCSWAGFPNNLDYWKDYPCRVKTGARAWKNCPSGTAFPTSAPIRCCWAA